jgi:hypothetical protein
MTKLLFFIALMSFALAIVTPAGAGLLDDIQNGYIDDVYTLPAAQEQPLINWQESGNVKGWIHILGFREMAHINGKDYVNGDPAKRAIVRGSAEVVSIPGVFDSLDKVITSERIPETKEVKATLKTVLHWHKICNDSKGSFVCGRYTENNDFVSSIISPEIFTPETDSINITDLSYNHSQITQRRLYIQTSDLITYYKVTTPNGSIARRIQIGQPDMNIYGIPFANFSSFETWNTTGTGITHQGNVIVLSSLNESYSIQAYTPFGEIQHLEPIITQRR